MINVDERKETQISTLGMEVKESKRAPDSTDVRGKNVRDVIKRMNSGKSPGIDAIKVMLKAGKKW